jgi:hypothetical protein
MVPYTLVAVLEAAVQEIRSRSRAVTEKRMSRWGMRLRERVRVRVCPRESPLPVLDLADNTRFIQRRTNFSIDTRPLYITYLHLHVKCMQTFFLEALSDADKPQSQPQA